MKNENTTFYRNTDLKNMMQLLTQMSSAIRKTPECLS